jgi:hypothetical protein
VKSSVNLTDKVVKVELAKTGNEMSKIGRQYSGMLSVHVTDLSLFSSPNRLAITCTADGSAMVSIADASSLSPV